MHDLEPREHPLATRIAKPFHQCVQTKGNQENRQEDDADSLQDVRPIGGHQSPEGSVEDHDNRDHGNEHILQGD